MSTPFTVKPTQKAVKVYYEALAKYAEQHVEHESAVRTAFLNLLDHTGRRFGWGLVPEMSIKTNGQSIRPDGTFLDDFHMKRGFWEAKDTHDDLDAEIQKKIKRGYPLVNTIFEDTRTAYLYQNGRQAMKVDLHDRRQLCDLLNAFFGHVEPAHESFAHAIDDFKERVPELARGLVRKIEEAHQDNAKFRDAFDRFFELCQASLNPNLSRAAVDEMIVQHLLTERLIRTIFDHQDFTRRNVIAAEVENVIDALVSKSFDRHAFLRSLDVFYTAIESAAATIEGFTEKQRFLNVVYERFFQGYSVKVADTHGIVYTPQEIVDFMCASVAEVLATEFGKKLGDRGVHILDPCTGTGNFIVNLLGRIPKRHLPRMYREQLFANEVMLMPYYIAALNIEHAYCEKTGEYEPFEGLCFVDTLDLAEAAQKTFGFMAERNIERVQRQKGAPITVVIGNPPYNQGQQDENDRNKNRRYRVVEERLRHTYVKDAGSTLRMQLYDPYVKFFRWATDRLQGRDGIVCLVSNNSFVDQVTFAGMRKHLRNDFTHIFHVDLHGNVRRNPKLSGTTHNVFGIQVGVGITVAARVSASRANAFRYFRVPEEWRKEEKLRWLATKRSIGTVDWQKPNTGDGATWRASGRGAEYAELMPIGVKRRPTHRSVFARHSPGVKTNADAYVFDFQRHALIARCETMVEDFNMQLDRWRRQGRPRSLDAFLEVRVAVHKWIRNTKKCLLRGEPTEFSKEQIRRALYRPFTARHYFFNRVFNEDTYAFPSILPGPVTERENQVIVVSDVAFRAATFSALVARSIPEQHLCASTDAHQCFPFYTYDEDGTNRRENITDWALKHFRDHYGNRRITKWHIFHYVYGVFHHPGYRELYAENLKRELPRIPLAPDFKAFRDAGKALAKLHLDYEELEPYELEWVETPDLPLSYRVEKMRLAKDKRSLRVNDSLTLAGIPPEVSQYRLGNRSALEWVVDQYRVKTDKRSGITSDPNCPEDPEYIVRLVGQVMHVSVETVKIVGGLPDDFGAQTESDGTAG
jgi:predicted helicase